MAEVGHKTEVNDLSLLSLLAAHEIERLQREEPSDGRYLAELRDRLEEQISGPSRADIRNVAPNTVKLYREAIHAATQVDPGDFVSLKGEITNLLNELGRVSESAKDRGAIGNLAPLLAFVSALHRQLLAQKQRAYTARSASHYRV
ncbi:hypothetical protein [Mesorhizobium sp.]|uniref:hypothetical protein n=1 Tax=Mesorhizobium sp. TaxID=1871066 RepID=UPI000FEA04C6|nr:hypothetical protein [Mesorhizobium sp.]RWM32444.1 MAG: hypothetical protein EOR75_29160 [Mesorhizobium sp.]TJV48222.1 MAG: hypothetical protein E5Y01_29410 [Mesorhizobium sp.]